jgi:hypothetical protein
MGILTLILAIAPVILQSLSANKTLPANIGGLISTVIQSITGFVATFNSAGATTTPGEAIAVLSALSAVIAVLRQQTTLDPGELAMVAAFDTAIAKGIAAYTLAGQKVDPAGLLPIEPIA